MDNIHKLKNLLVSSCQSIKEGNRDIGINLLEIAADLMETEDITPEVIETQFVTQVNENIIPTEFESAADQDYLEIDDKNKTKEKMLNKALDNYDEEETEDKSVDAITEQASHKSLRDIISNWGITNADVKAV